MSKLRIDPYSTDRRILSRLSHLRPCDNCGEPIAPIFHIVEYSLGMVEGRKASMTLGITAYFHGALNLAEVLSPGGEVVDSRTTEHKVTTQLLICNDCIMRDLSLKVIAERVYDKREQWKAENGIVEEDEEESDD